MSLCDLCASWLNNLSTTPNEGMHEISDPMMIASSNRHQPKTVKHSLVVSVWMVWFLVFLLASLLVMLSDVRPWVINILCFMELSWNFTKFANFCFNLKLIAWQNSIYMYLDGKVNNESKKTVHLGDPCCLWIKANRKFLLSLLIDLSAAVQY